MSPLHTSTRTRVVRSIQLAKSRQNAYLSTEKDGKGESALMTGHPRNSRPTLGREEDGWDVNFQWCSNSPPKMYEQYSRPLARHLTTGQSACRIQIVVTIARRTGQNSRPNPMICANVGDVIFRILQMRLGMTTSTWET